MVWASQDSCNTSSMMRLSLDAPLEPVGFQGNVAAADAADHSPEQIADHAAVLDRKRDPGSTSGRVDAVASDDAHTWRPALPVKFPSFLERGDNPVCRWKPRLVY